MFKFNRRTDYALRLLLNLAQNQDRGLIKSNELSEAASVPAPFTHKIIRDLARGGLVWTSSGPEGGAGLARPADSISLLDVVETMEGPIHLNFCRLGPEPCQYPDSDRCPVHPIWEKMNGMIQEELRQTNLVQLLANMRD